MTNELTVLKALWAAATRITEGEDSGSGHCRYCGATDYAVDIDGNRIEDYGEADQYHRDHDETCPSAIIDCAFDGLDEEMVGRVLATAMAEGTR